MSSGELITKQQFRDELAVLAKQDKKVKEQLESVNYIFEKLPPPKQEKILAKMNLKKVTRYVRK